MTKVINNTLPSGLWTVGTGSIPSTSLYPDNAVPSPFAISPSMLDEIPFTAPPQIAVSRQQEAHRPIPSITSMAQLQPDLDIATQEALQKASMDGFSFTNLTSSALDAGQTTSAVVWSNGSGLHINPTPASLMHLEQAGINPDDISYIVLTEANEETASGINELVRQRARISIVATETTFEQTVAMVNNMRKGRDDVRRAVNRVQADRGSTFSLRPPNGDKVDITIGDGFDIAANGETVTSDAIAKAEPLASHSIVSRSLANDGSAMESFLQNVSLFSHLDPIDIATISQEGEIVEFRPGDELMRKGDESDCCYVMLTGAADVIDDHGAVIWTYHSRGFPGDIGVQSGEPRSATVQARTHCTALKIDKELFHRTVSRRPHDDEDFTTKKYALERFFQAVVPEIKLSITSLDAMAVRTTITRYENDIAEGETGDCAYMILSGEVEVCRTDSEAPLAVLGKDHIVGEMALFNPSARRTASVVVKGDRPVEVLRIPRKLLEFILFHYPGVDAEMRKMIIARRRQNRATLDEPHMVRIPDYLIARSRHGERPDDVFGNWQGFRNIYGIDFHVEGTTVDDLSRFSLNIETLHRMLRHLLGESLLRQGLVQHVKVTDAHNIESSYDPLTHTLSIAKSLLGTGVQPFAQTLLRTIGDITAAHLVNNELLPEEVDEIEAAWRTLVDNRDQLPAELAQPFASPAATEADVHGMLASFLPLYVMHGDELRRQRHSLETSPETSSAFATLYDIYRKLYFHGIELTRARSAQPLAAITGRRRMASTTTTFSPYAAATEIEDMLSDLFGRFATYDSLGLYRKIYEPEIFNRFKRNLLRHLRGFPFSFHLQKFTDREIEISFYHAASNTRFIVPFAREKERVLFRWRIAGGVDNVKAFHGKEPTNVSLINLESSQFSGVRGTPENVLTLETMIRKHRAREASVSLYDCQWPENSIDAFVEETKINPPDVIGVSATFGTRSELEKLLNKLGNLPAKPLVVVGGLLSTWSYDRLLEKYPDIICVHHEGEEAISQIVEMVGRMPVDNRRRFIEQNVGQLRDIPNIAFVHRGNVMVHPKSFVDLSLVPAPDRTTQVHRQVPAGHLLNAEGMGRGCGYSRCFFCTRTHGKIRLFPMERGLEDFRSYMEAGVPFIVYVDEDFLPQDDPQRAIEFARGIIEMKKQYRDRYVANHGTEPVLPSFYIAARATAFFQTEDAAGNAKRLEALRMLKEAGLVKVFLGAESGAEVQFNKTYHKGGSIPEVEEAIRIIHGQGLQVVAGFITFDPVQTTQQLEQDIDFMKRNGLVYVDPLKEPLNPFKYLRAQAGSALARNLRRIGLLASSMDPDVLSHDTAYRNPLIRLITQAGKSWKDLTEKLDYHLKGIIWVAEQSPEEMQRAEKFVELFNRLKEMDLELIEALLAEVNGLNIDEEQAITAFLNATSQHTREKARFELRRALFPHDDVYKRLTAYMDERIDSGEQLDFVRRFLAGAIPDDFNFGNSSRADYERWLADIRADIAHSMLHNDRIAALAARANDLLHQALRTRLELLDDFAREDWEEYYRAHPEAVRRGRDFQHTLEEARALHAKNLRNASGLIGEKDLEVQPYAIYWRTSMEDFLNYRHPDMGVAVAQVLRVIDHLSNHPDEPVARLRNIHVYEDDRLSFTGTNGGRDHGAIVKDAVEKLYLKVLNIYRNNSRAQTLCREIYQRVREGTYENLGAVAKDLKKLYRLASKQNEVTVENNALSIVPTTRDGKTIFTFGRGNEAPTISVQGNYAAASVQLNGPATELDVAPDRITPHDPQAFVSEMQRTWRTLLKNGTGLSEQERINVVNSIAALMMVCENIDVTWIDTLAEDIDRNVAPHTLYLPDTSAYHAWKTARPDMNVVFVHPGVYHRIWPGIASHLEKIPYLAKPELFDDYDTMLGLVSSGKIPPSWARFIYEVYFNLLRPKAFRRNENAEDIVRRYTSLSNRLMPTRTPTLLLDQDDPRVEKFAAVTDDVAQVLETRDGRVRLVIHPQVYHTWRDAGEIPFKDERIEWALVYPTSSARTLYVLGSNHDYIAKTHSLIWIGPAKRTLKASNIIHSHNISRQIRNAIDQGILPASIRDIFGYINDEAAAIVRDPAYYSDPEEPDHPDKSSVGSIPRSTAAYPHQDADRRILIPGFALHSNAATVPNNTAPEVIVQLIDHNVKGTGQNPVDFFVDRIVKPLYQTFFYFMFKQGILLEPHGQNFFLEVDDAGMLMRHDFKDWQSTMVDMETRIARGLPEGSIAKHFLGKEAGTPLSLSLVFDYYFSTYLFGRIVDCVARAYRGNMTLAAFKAHLTNRLKNVFESEINVYEQRRGEFPDNMVRHGKKPKDDQTNTVWFKVADPPPFRLSSYEREIHRVIAERQHRGVITVPMVNVQDPSAAIDTGDSKSVMHVDLERSRLYVKNGTWSDVRDVERKPEQSQGAYHLILPKNYDRTRKYPLVVMLHGMKSDGREVSTWVDRIGKDDVITVVPLAPFRNTAGKHYWFRDDRPEEKDAAVEYLREIVADLSGKLNVSRRVIGGISQGGYMALHTILYASDVFDDAFAVNTPFAERYLPVIPAPNVENGNRRIRLMHLEDDQIVPPHHSDRAEEFFRSQGFDVKRRPYIAGQHREMTDAMARDLASFVDDSNSGEDVSFPSPHDLRTSLRPPKPGTEEYRDQMTAISRIASQIAAIGTARVPGYEAVLFETMLDGRLPLSVRAVALSALEQMRFTSIFDVWDETALVSAYRDADMKLRSLARKIDFLTAHIAFLGRSNLPKDLMKQFDVIVSSLRTAEYNHALFGERAEGRTGRKHISALIDTIDYLFETAQNLTVHLTRKLSISP